MGQALKWVCPYFFIGEKRMVTEKEFKVTPEGNLSKFIGLSTDTKPTANVVNGSEFFEMDQGATYFFNADADAGEEWVNPFEPEVE